MYRNSLYDVPGPKHTNSSEPETIDIEKGVAQNTIIALITRMQ